MIHSHNHREGSLSAWVESSAAVVQAVTRFYYFGGKRVAERQGSAVYYLHGDHLGSASLVTDASGSVVSQSRYLPYGELRWARGARLTDFAFTGQRVDNFGLMDYHARHYSTSLGRFISADSMVPNAFDPPSFDRYGYVRSNPVKYTDPNGHAIPCEQGDICDHGYPNPPLNPWRRPASQSAIGRDRTADLNEDYDQLFLNHASSPVRNGKFAGFGGCSTYSGCNGEYHPTIDTLLYVYKEGTPIYAMAYGKVVAVGFEDYGYFVMIEHCVTDGNCVYSIYAHLQAGSIEVKVGDMVGPNTQIAGMGGTIDADSGGSTFIHLHLEVRRASNVLLNNPNQPFSSGYKNGKYFTPAWWVKSRVQLNALFVDLGSLFGYHGQYKDMPLK